MSPAIRSSRVAKLGAALLAATLHGAMALALMQPQPKAEIDGAPSGEASLGSSFADMAMGTISSEPSPETITAEPALLPEAPQTVTPAEPVTAVARIAPAPLSAEPDAVATIAPEQAAPLAALPPEPTAPIAPEKDTPSDTAVAVSRRPAQRPDTLEVPKPATQQTQAQRTAKPQQPAPQRQSAPQGNADRTARAGQATGRDRGTSASSGAGGTSRQAGNAAASNYPGIVMGKLSRVPRPRLNSRGAAVIAFRIAANGGLAGLSVARSSGSSALDQAALRVIQRAAPFPPPPAGAQRSFSIQIQSR